MNAGTFAAASLFAAAKRPMTALRPWVQTRLDGLAVAFFALCVVLFFVCFRDSPKQHSCVSLEVS